MYLISSVCVCFDNGRIYFNIAGPFNVGKYVHSFKFVFICLRSKYLRAMDTDFIE